MSALLVVVILAILGAFGFLAGKLSASNKESANYRTIRQYAPKPRINRYVGRR